MLKFIQINNMNNSDYKYIYILILYCSQSIHMCISVAVEHEKLRGGGGRLQVLQVGLSW